MVKYTAMTRQSDVVAQQDRRERGAQTGTLYAAKVHACVGEREGEEQARRREVTTTTKVNCTSAR
eukprot:6176714-Pleurochrysis_carterae.AAC.4